MTPKPITDISPGIGDPGVAAGEDRADVATGTVLAGSTIRRVGHVERAMGRVDRASRELDYALDELRQALAEGEAGA